MEVGCRPGRAAWPMRRRRWRGSAASADECARVERWAETVRSQQRAAGLVRAWWWMRVEGGSGGGGGGGEEAGEKREEGGRAGLGGLGGVITGRADFRATAGRRTRASRSVARQRVSGRAAGHGSLRPFLGKWSRGGGREGSRERSSAGKEEEIRHLSAPLARPWCLRLSRQRPRPPAIPLGRSSLFALSRLAAATVRRSSDIDAGGHALWSTAAMERAQRREREVEMSEAGPRVGFVFRLAFASVSRQSRVLGLFRAAYP
jgi:hypothetical protein